MGAVGYRGLVNLGFRYDGRDDRYKLIDVNPRLGASFRSFVTKDGTDILRACYLDLTGQHVSTTRAFAGRKWMLEHDLRSCITYHREGRSFKNLLARHQGVEEFAHFSLDDPFPLLAMCFEVLSRPVRRWGRSRNHYSADLATEGEAFGA
jgi:predicted ATP-grasp superfamily ATP-dependent carboligase